jgi:hypothetical protein
VSSDNAWTATPWMYGAKVAIKGIEQAPKWVLELLPSPEERAAGHAETEAALAAIRQGDRSRVATLDELLADLDAAEDPGAQAV